MTTLRILPSRLQAGRVLVKPVVMKKTDLRGGPIVSIADDQFSIDERTARIIANITSDAEKLADPKMRSLWLDAVQTFAQTGDAEGLVEVCKWRRTPVDMDQFMFDEAYIGLDRSEVFPEVLNLLNELDTDKYNECVLGGALGIGKTFAANIFIARSIYKLSCMRHPQTTFKLQARSALVFTIQSIRLGTAKKAVFQELGQYIRNSPYFTQIYPFDKYIQSELLFREQRISVLPVSSSTTGVISMNVLGGELDEANYFQKILKSKSSEAEADGTFDQAQKLYLALSRRRKTRFNKLGKVPGMFFIISSAKYPGDFTERKAAEAESMGGTDKSIYVWIKSQMEVKPLGTFLPEKFRVQVGTDMVRSRILNDNEDQHPLCDVVEVPEDFRSDFMKDIDGALRDICGKTSRALRPFMPNRDKVRECMDEAEERGFVNPFPFDTYDLSMGIPHPNLNALRLDIDAPRAVHVDLGLKRDAAGLAIGHVVGIKQVERKMPDGFIQISYLPVVAYDVILRIVPPPHGEIEFALIRKFIKDLRDLHKLPIKYVTYDGFESVDSRQILKTEGFLTDYLSVDAGMEAYNGFKDAIYDVRALVHKNQFLAAELAGLQYSLVRGGSREKVDHRPDGTKDVADAVCGVYAFLMNRKSSWRDVRPMNFQPKIAKPAVEGETSREVIVIPSARGSPSRRVVVQRSNPIRSTPQRRTV